jgi:hypothetical protein
VRPTIGVEIILFWTKCVVTKQKLKKWKIDFMLKSLYISASFYNF